MVQMKKKDMLNMLFDELDDYIKSPFEPIELADFDEFTDIIGEENINRFKLILKDYEKNAFMIGFNTALELIR